MNEHTRIYHVRFGPGRGDVTLALNTISRRVAAAWCHPKDQFARKRGRDIAKARLDNDYATTVQLPTYFSESFPENNPVWGIVVGNCLNALVSVGRLPIYIAEDKIRWSFLNSQIVRLLAQGDEEVEKRERSLEVRHNC